MNTEPDDDQPPESGLTECKINLPLNGNNPNQYQDSKLPSNSDAQRIAQQAEEVFVRKGKRWDTFFYKVVLGGNVKIANEVIECIHERRQVEVLNWLLDTGRKKHRFHSYGSSSNQTHECILLNTMHTTLVCNTLLLGAIQSVQNIASIVY